MMQRADAGMPTETASVIRVAINGNEEKKARKGRGLKLTNITPHWCPVYGITGP